MRDIWKAVSFRNSSTPRPDTSAAEKALKELGVRYGRRLDGTLIVRGDLSLSNSNLTELPDLSSVYVTGGFYCSNNKLTSLKGAPYRVGKDFFCSGNELTSLDGAPRRVGYGFYCEQNELTTLEGAPDKVGGIFNCAHNKLSSLLHLPKSIGGAIYCDDNRLETLEHAPDYCNGDFSCRQNPLTCLAFAPHVFSRIISDFGTFDSDAGIFAKPKDLPEEMRLTPEARFNKAATVLGQPLKVFSPLHLKRDMPGLR